MQSIEMRDLIIEALKQREKAAEMLFSDLNRLLQSFARQSLLPRNLVWRVLKFGHLREGDMSDVCV